jgi:hypothetical protein
MTVMTGLTLRTCLLNMINIGETGFPVLQRFLSSRTIALHTPREFAECDLVQRSASN